MLNILLASKKFVVTLTIAASSYGLPFSPAIVRHSENCGEVTRYKATHYQFTKDGIRFINQNTSALVTLTSGDIMVEDFFN